MKDKMKMALAEIDSQGILREIPPCVMECAWAKGVRGMFLQVQHHMRRCFAIISDFITSQSFNI